MNRLRSLHLRFCTIATLLVGVGALTSVPAGAQRLAVPLERLESERLETRIGTFYWLLHRRPSERFDAAEATGRVLRRYASDRATIHTTLIRLLEQETVRAQGRLSRAQLTYYADLVLAVASLGDASAADALLASVNVPGSAARRGVAALGAGALAPVLRSLRSERPAVRNTAIHTVGLLLTARSSNVGAADLQQLRGALLSALSDPVTMNRAAALEALRPFAADAAVQQAVRRVAGEDADLGVRRRAGGILAPPRVSAGAFGPVVETAEVAR
jgi:hypothetical protein